MYKNVIDPDKWVSFILKDIDIGGQILYLMCTGPLINMSILKIKMLLQMEQVPLHGMG